MSDGLDMGKFITDTADTHRRLMQQGIDIGEGRFHRMIRALDAAYRKAALRPETKIPTELEVVIYALVAMLPVTSAQDAINAYAEAGIRRDQRERLEGRSTQTRSGGEGIDPRNGGTLKHGA